jgi:hypothetical protein
MLVRMEWGFRRTYRRVTAAVALLSVAFYALLLPWHLTSQFARQLFAADFGISAQAMCSADASGRSVPGAPDSSCPICKGLAAFHFAIAPAAQAELAPPPAVAVSFAHAREDLAGARLPHPRNRGPPLPS